MGTLLAVTLWLALVFLLLVGGLLVIAIFLDILTNGKSTRWVEQQADRLFVDQDPKE